MVKRNQVKQKAGRGFQHSGVMYGRAGHVADVGVFYNPPRDPPMIIENKWRFARLKLNVAAAGDSGAIENITPARVFEVLKAQQGVDITAALASCRIIGTFSYALPGVADSGAQVYPSTKLRVYTPMEDSSQGVLVAQREDSGTLEVPGKVGYRYPRHLAERVLNGAGSNYFIQIENYHTARGLVYLDIYWCSNPN